MPATTLLIVNADDFGYSAGISRGILDCARAGAVTATGVFATSRTFEEHVTWLRMLPELDLGVHLSLSHGRPLSAAMTRACARWGGRFPRRRQLAWALASRHLSRELLTEEWRAQIQRCLAAGIEVRFLNSHEHVHMWPPLLGVLLELARECRVPFVRYARPEWTGTLGAAGPALRGAVLQVLDFANRGHAPVGMPALLGVSCSGRLNLAYLEKRFAALPRGRSYELMCHPGYCDPYEIRDERLLRFHHWDQELELLRGRAFADLCRAHHIALARFRDLTAPGGAEG